MHPTSTKINLWFARIRSPALEEKLPSIGKLTRLFCSIKLKRRQGWTDSHNAIVDTGAPISVIPLDIWSEIEVKMLAQHEIQGVNPKKECALPASVGRVKCILLDDEGNQSKELEILSYLAHTNLVPLIIGFRDLLERFSVFFDYRINQSIIEEKKLKLIES